MFSDLLEQHSNEWETKLHIVENFSFLVSFSLTLILGFDQVGIGKIKKVIIFFGIFYVSVNCNFEGLRSISGPIFLEDIQS